MTTSTDKQQNAFRDVPFMGVIYVVHDINRPERYGLPKTPVRPPSYTYWKWIAKPAGLLLAGLGVLAVFFHRVAVGPKLAQPEAPLVESRPDPVEAKRKEQP